MAMVMASSNSDLLLTAGAMAAALLSVQAWLNHEGSDPGEIVSDCADGTVIGLRRDRIRRRLGPTTEQIQKFVSWYWPGAKPPGRRTLRSLASDDLKPGDLSLARVRRGAAGDDAWVLEGLNRDHDATWIAWSFDREEVARATLVALERRVVRTPRAPSGEAFAVTEADFDAVQERERFESERYEAEHHEFERSEG